MTKPIGPICNLNCSYCFYLEKEKLFPRNETFRMPVKVLETYIRTYIASQNTREISFAWQGGEPTLLGVAYFQKIVELQKRHADGRTITNTIQTNATLLDDTWAAFLKEHDFLVGVSIDGPRELHDAYRVGKRGEPSFDGVMRGLNLLKQHGIRFNTLTVVNRLNAKKPQEVYQFLKGLGSKFLQFIPLVERAAHGSGPNLELAAPPDDPRAPDSPVTPWSVDPHDYGSFLVSIFDKWVRHDVGRVYVGIFDEALEKWAGREGGLCVFNETCGVAMAMEHNGDVYSCDHYVYPRYKLGNILRTPIRELAESPEQRRFGNEKRDLLPDYCQRCDVRFACNGECPKHRFATTPDGDPGLNYLCPAYQKFFRHIDPAMRIMARLWRAKKAPALIMDLLHNDPGTDDLSQKNQKLHALVNGEMVPQHLFHEARTVVEERFREELSPSKFQKAEERIREDTLRFAIERQLLIQEARRRFPVIPDARVAVRTSEILFTCGGMDGLVSHGFEEVNLRESVLDQCRYEHLMEALKKEVSPPDDRACRDAYETEKDLFRGAKNPLRFADILPKLRKCLHEEMRHDAIRSLVDELMENAEIL